MQKYLQFVKMKYACDPMLPIAKTSAHAMQLFDSVTPTDIVADKAYERMRYREALVDNHLASLELLLLLGNNYHRDKFAHATGIAIGHEGFLTDVKNIVTGAIRTLIRWLTSCVRWISKTIAGLLGVDAKIKKNTDEKYHQFITALRALAATDKSAANERFLNTPTHYTPIFSDLTLHCKIFETTVKLLNINAEKDLCKDLLAFDDDTTAISKTPDWLSQSQKELSILGFTVDGTSISWKSPYLHCAESTYGALQFGHIDSIEKLNAVYTKNVWENMHFLEKFEKTFQRALELANDKQRQFKEDKNTEQLKLIVANIKYIKDSGSMMTAIIMHLRSINRALHTRRKTAIMSGLAVLTNIKETAE